MQRPTLAVFRAQFPTEVMGVCQTDPKVAVYCNDAQQRLLMDPLAPEEGWWGGWVTLVLTATIHSGSAYVVAPRDIARLIVTAVCQNPIPIRNGFYEYLQFSPGLYPKTCGTNCGSVFQAYERDNVVTFSPLLSSPQTIRVYPSDTRDIGLQVLVQGKDINGVTVLGTNPASGLTIPGEYLSVQFPFVDSANIYSTITGLMKDETYGPLQFFQVNPATGVETPLSTMEPSEGQASYRRYLVTGIPSTNLCCLSPTNTLQLTAQGRLDFIPVESETDYLTLPNVPALIEEAISIRYSRMDSGNAAQQSAIHHQRAIALLNGQLDVYEGKTSTAVKVPIFGSQKMHRQPV